MYDVFISYRRKTGSEFASFLHRELTRLGYNVFFDAESLRAGEFEPQIDQAIQECTFFLLLLAQDDSTNDLDNSIKKPKSDWIVHELQLAYKYNTKKIIPIKIKESFEFPKKIKKVPVLQKISETELCNMSGVTAANSISVLLKDFMKDEAAKKLADEYNNSIITPNYIKWELETLKSIYHDIPFVNAFGKEYPAFVIPGAKSVNYPFNSLTRVENLLPVENELNYKDSPFYNEFKKIVGPHIHYPDLYGYTNCGFNLDENGNVESLTSRPRTYKESVYTCHILQFELWSVYKKIGHERLATLDDLPMRKKIHGNLSNREVILSGCNRSSLNDVTIAVIDRNERTQDYDIATAIRSENVATYPNYFGFVPSGGFELYELEVNQSATVIEENYSVIGALYREYIEELFGDVNFGQATGDDDLNRLYRNTKVQELINGVESGLYKFEFLGVDFDLITLRQTLAFVLKIDDKKFFYKNEIKKNEENKTIKFYSLKKLEDWVQKDQLPVLSETAATYALLKEHEIYKELSSTNFNE